MPDQSLPSAKKFVLLLEGRAAKTKSAGDAGYHQRAASIIRELIESKDKALREARKLRAENLQLKNKVRRAGV